MPSMGEQKDTWGKRNGAAPILGVGGKEEGEISLRDRSRCHDQKQPRTSQLQSSGSLKTVPPLRAVDSKQMSALL